MQMMKTAPSPKGMRLPHGTNALLHAWHLALVHLIDSRATLLEAEEMYAVFEEKSASYALAMLSVGFARYASDIVLCAEELPDKIVFRLTGVCRKAGTHLSQNNMLPKSKERRTLLEDYLSRSGMAFFLSQEENTLSLSIVFSRFLAERYDVRAVDAESLYCTFYDAMLFLSGDAPKRPLPR